MFISLITFLFNMLNYLVMLDINYYVTKNFSDGTSFCFCVIRVVTTRSFNPYSANVENMVSS